MAASKKDAYWFPHDAGASHDPRMLRLRRKFGIGGYGAYFFFIERLREASPEYKIELSSVDDIAYDGQFDVEIFNECMAIGLFESDGDFFWSAALVERMEHYDNIRKKRAASGAVGGRVKAKTKRGRGKSKTNAEQMKIKGLANSSQDRTGQDRRDETPKCVDSSLKINGENEIDNILDNEMEEPNGQVVEYEKDSGASRLVPLLRELWSGLGAEVAEQLYMKIRVAYSELSLDRLEEIIRKAWVKWPVDQSIHESGRLGAWLVNEIDFTLRGDKREAEHQAMVAARQAERAGTAAAKPDPRVSLERLAADLQKGRGGGGAVHLQMDRVQRLIAEAVEDGIALPAIVLRWLDKGGETGAFELAENKKLLSYHRNSGTPMELIAAPPPPMTREEVEEQVRIAKEKLNTKEAQKASESPTTPGMDAAPEGAPDMSPDDMRVLEAARLRSLARTGETPTNAPASVADMIGPALGVKGDDK